MTDLNTKNVIAYMRVSTKIQDKSHLSFDHQESKIGFYCNVNNLNIVHAFKEVASGKGMQRDGIKNMVNMIHGSRQLSNTIEGVVVFSIDRLTRSTSDYKKMQDLIFNDLVGVKLHVVNGGGLTHPTSKALMKKVMQAERELEAIRARTREALDAKRAKGEPTGRPPYGFKFFNKQLVEVEHEQDAIKEMIDLRSKGHTFREISLRLSSQGMFARSGRPFHRGTLSRMLKGVAVQRQCSTSGPGSGRIPYGFKSVGDRLIEAPGEQLILSLMRSKRKQGYTIREIVSYLTENNINTRSGKPFSMGTVARYVKDTVKQKGVVDKPIVKIKKHQPIGEQLELF